MKGIDYAMAAIMLNAVNQNLPPERKALLPIDPTASR
jgi:hypothetical protein